MSSSSSLVPSLMFATLGIVFVGLLIFYALHMRKPSNRHSMDNAPERGEPGAPDKPRGEPLAPNEAKRA